MKTKTYLIGNTRWMVPGQWMAWMAALCLATSFGTLGSAALAQSFAPKDPQERPEIVDIQLVDGQVIVTVQVPRQLQRVTLESRTRMNEGAWVPRAVKRLSGDGGLVEFRLAESAKLEILRVRALPNEPLPTSFYSGQTEFQGPASKADSNGNPPTGQPTFGMPDAAERSLDGGGGTGGNRSVVESDIWAIRGTRLYFFNQLRGLQIIDLEASGDDAIQATYSLPAAGEQMYVLDDDHVILLARRACTGGTEAESEVIILNVDNDQPAEVTAFVVPGRIQESRLVGTALYVASQTYERAGEGRERVWEYGSTLTSFDLSNPAQPSEVDRERYLGFGNVVQATDRFLMIAVRAQRWLDPATLHLVDIRDPNGQMDVYGTIRATGHVADKFKMNLNEDVFTVISEFRNRDFTRRGSILETFDISGAKPARLGSVEVGHGESLFATRFDGDRAYIVTFLRIDPLWIVDLSDPANPTVTGELEIPGWSTYIEPLGDRLVTVGIDNVEGWRVAVQLFDVADPTKPTLLSKVPLGDNHSWSEANSDEKALSVLPDAGLVLVPFQGWSEGTYASAVQLIDLERDTLRARGVIDHEMQPRRATVWRDHILTISGREFLKVDASDRDRPQLVSETELSWSADRIFTHGPYLIELSRLFNHSGNDDSIVRVVDTADTDTVLNAVALPKGRSIVGGAVRADRLYLALTDGEQNDFFWREPIAVDDAVAEDSDQKPEAPQPEPPSLWTVVYDLSQLPALSVLGEAEVVLESGPVGYGFGIRLEALWPSADVLVWSGGGFGGPMPFLRAAPGLVADIWYPWWGGNGRERLLAFDVEDSAAPAFLSEVNLAESGTYWNFSQAFAADGLIFLSHQFSEFQEGVQLPGEPPARPVVIDDEGQRKLLPEDEERPVGIWVQKYFLDVVDYADPANPTVRPPVDISGHLEGVSHNGNVVYTVGVHWTEDFKTDHTQRISASAYDGVEVSLIDSLELGNLWPRPYKIASSGTVYRALPLSRQEEGGLLEAWKLNDAGKFAVQHRSNVNPPIHELAVLEDRLLARTDRQIDVWFPDASGRLEPIASGTPIGCLWVDLNAGAVDGAGTIWFPMNDFGVFGIEIE